MNAKILGRRTCLIGSLAGAALLVGSVAPSWAQSEAIQSQDTNLGGIAADITQCKRKDGVLTLRLRVRNTGSKSVEVRFADSASYYDGYYLTAGEKKYFILRDSEGVPLATDTGGGRAVVSVGKDGSYTWWAKYPAPPADITSVTFYTPIAPPFEDIPITD
jgi:hypothetical protein